LYAIDAEQAERVRARGCECGGRLHRADYPRKVRGLGPEHEALLSRRLSFCCAREGCRRRHTPPSVRFWGRMVYAAAVVVLVMSGLDAANGLLPGAALVPRQTRRRWRTQLPARIAGSTFWQQARADVSPPVCESALPQSLMARFSGGVAEALVWTLRFFSPLTTRCAGFSRPR
jgi:hypothetical protein